MLISTQLRHTCHSASLCHRSSCVRQCAAVFVARRVQLVAEGIHHAYQNGPLTQVATIPLQALLSAASQESAAFEVAAVVSQPARKRGRGPKAPMPSPVHQLALDSGVPDERILTPVKANEVRAALACIMTTVLHVCVHRNHIISDERMTVARATRMDTES